MTGTLRSHVATEFEELERLAGEWNRLWRSSLRGEIFSTFAWARAWWKAYGQRRSLCTPVLYRGDVVVGILPMVLEGRLLRFLGTPGADYNDLVCADGTSAEVLKAALLALAQLPTPWTECILENVSDQSQLMGQLHELPPHLRSRVQLTSRTPSPSVVLGQNREEVLATILGKKRLRQQQERLERLGNVRFRHLEDHEEIRHHLPRFFQQHQMRCAVAGDTSLFLQEEIPRFYDALVDELEPHHELRFSVLELDGKPIAYHFGFESNQKFLFYKPTFDVDYWDYSPGMVLLKKLFEYVAHGDLREFDFTGGREPYKDRFVNHVRFSHTVNFYASGPRAKLLYSYHRAKEELKKKEKIFRAVKAAVARLKSPCSSIRQSVSAHGVMSLTKSALSASFRTVAFGREEVLVYAKESGAALGPSEPFSHFAGKLSLRQGTLSDLAKLCIEHPRSFDTTRLQPVRGRLKRGDQLFLAQEGDEVVQVAWMGLREATSARSGLAAARDAKTEKPVSVIYDCWSPTPAGKPRILAWTLRQIAGIASTQSGEVWIACRRDEADSQRAIEEAGFQLRRHVVHLRLFYWIRRAGAVRIP